jgi:hypothetical protein
VTDAPDKPEPELPEPVLANPQPGPEPDAGPEPAADAAPRELTDEEKDAEGARRLRTLAAALANLDDASISRGIATMREQSRVEVAERLQLSKATIRLGDALVPLLRRKVLAATPSRQLSVAFALVEEANDEAIALLGDDSEDPSRADMDAVLPALIESQGLPTVALMVAAYACSDAQCQRVMGEILDTDERFVLPDPPPPEVIDEVEVVGVTTITRIGDDPAQAEKRAQRKAAKAAKREAELRKQEAAAAAQAVRREAQHRANQQRSPKS